MDGTGRLSAGTRAALLLTALLLLDAAALPHWEVKLRQKLAELAEEELAAHLSGNRNLPTVNRRPLLKSKKRACFWKYCV